jgi:hypothetical protein
MERMKVVRLPELVPSVKFPALYKALPRSRVAFAALAASDADISPAIVDTSTWLMRFCLRDFCLRTSKVDFDARRREGLSAQPFVYRYYLVNFTPGCK